MYSRTRYFVIASLLVLTVGLGAGLVAYYQVLPVGASGSAPDELRFLPKSAALVAYADVQGVVSSDLRQKLLGLIPTQSESQKRFEALTGIKVERDLDRVVAGVVHPSGDAQPSTPSMLVLARGRFDQVKIEALMREHGAMVETYKGVRHIVGTGDMSLAFVEPGLAAVGGPVLVRSAIDLHSGGESVLANTELMERVQRVGAGSAWAVGRFEALVSQAQLPAHVAGQIPPITWFSMSGHVTDGVRATLNAETRDDASAASLRDVVRGLIAFARLQAGSRPDIQELANSVELGGTGSVVTLSFELPSRLFDALAARQSSR
jgi:hypothetical protein